MDSFYLFKVLDIWIFRIFILSFELFRFSYIFGARLYLYKIFQNSIKVIVGNGSRMIWKGTFSKHEYLFCPCIFLLLMSQIIKIIFVVPSIPFKYFDGFKNNL